MIIYYQEPCGDYLAVNTSTADCYSQNFGRDEMEGRATAIAGRVTSVCTTGVSRLYLKGCRRVAKKDVPKEWLEAIGLN